MTTNERMLKLLAELLHDEPMDAFPAEEWPAVFQELCKHTVQCIPGVKATCLGLSNEDTMELLNAVGRNVKRYQQSMLEQQKVSRCLEDIPVVVLKGAAAAMYYPQPMNRCVGDIDLIVPKEQFVQAYELLKAAGYTPEQTPEDRLRHIDFRSSAGLEIELHEHFSTSNNPEQNEALDQYVYEGIRHRETVTLGQFSVPVLPALENGLVLLAHINQHISSGLGLRQIMDWMCYVERELNDEMWRDRFSAAAEKIGLKQLAIVTTAMCRKYLGLRGADWCNEAQDDLTDELMAYVLSHGNFGRSDAAASKSADVVRLFRNPVRGLITAQKKGLRTWQAVKKYPVLKPFAWCYQIIRWISHGRQMDVTVSALGEHASRERRETDFLKRLGITRL